jgi:hypothetical protein
MPQTPPTRPPYVSVYFGDYGASVALYLCVSFFSRHPGPDFVCHLVDELVLAVPFFRCTIMRSPVSMNKSRFYWCFNSDSLLLSIHCFIAPLPFPPFLAVTCIISESLRRRVCLVNPSDTTRTHLRRPSSLVVVSVPGNFLHSLSVSRRAYYYPAHRSISPRFPAISQAIC